MCWQLLPITGQLASSPKNKEAARMFIEYIAKDAQFIADSGLLPTRKVLNLSFRSFTQLSMIW